jgi:hypothetical protein
LEENKLPLSFVPAPRAVGLIVIGSKLPTGLLLFIVYKIAGGTLKPPSGRFRETGKPKQECICLICGFLAETPAEASVYMLRKPIIKRRV